MKTRTIIKKDLKGKEYTILDQQGSHPKFQKCLSLRSMPAGGPYDKKHRPLDWNQSLQPNFKNFVIQKQGKQQIQFMKKYKRRINGWRLQYFSPWEEERLGYIPSTKNLVYCDETEKHQNQTRREERKRHCTLMKLAPSKSKKSWRI